MNRKKNEDSSSFDGEMENVSCIRNKRNRFEADRKIHTQQQSYRVVITNYIKMIPAIGWKENGRHNAIRFRKEEEENSEIKSIWLLLNESQALVAEQTIELRTK